MARILQGKSKQWQVGDSPIGSGDAGEVYSAACVDAPETAGVIKKPARVATGGTLQRQAKQIAQEAQALVRLDGLPQGKAHPPRLLDEAPAYTQGTANYFIVSESAPGEALDAMLSQTRQAGKPFPRRVIITVLDALFDLFARSHQAGVLWNDVKLDHIYWHNPTGSVTVIDWGNALFMDQPQPTARRMPPRWEDYRQFVETLGNFLQPAAPELYADLGWDEFTGADLDLPTVSILARRIAYQQEVIALKEMEYRALMNVVLSADPEMQGLEAIAEYQHVLETIGAPWPRTEVSGYSRDLLHNLARDGHRRDSLRTIALMFDLFGESLDLPWHILREIFRQADLVAHPDLGLLVNPILNQNWVQALWRLAAIASEGEDAPWWPLLVPVMRQKATGLVTLPPLEICQTAINWLGSHQPAGPSAALPGQLTQQQWRQKGAEFQENPIDYPLLEALAHEKALPRQMSVQVKTSYAAGKKAIREMLLAWVEMAWENIEPSIQFVLAWDPDRWALLRLAEEIRCFKDWLQRLYEGPASGIPMPDFLTVMLESQPQVDRVLGQPPWFLSLQQTLRQLSSGSHGKPPLEAVRNWCPWVLSYAPPAQPGQPESRQDAETAQTLTHFVRHLRAWSDVEAGLEFVLDQAPAFHPTCKKLFDGFHTALSLNFRPEPLLSLWKNPPHPALQEACQALAALIQWRAEVSSRSLACAEQSICQDSLMGWQVISHACERTRDWETAILPALVLIDDGLPVLENSAWQVDDPPLVEIIEKYGEMTRTWSQIYQSRVHPHWLETLKEAVDQTRSLFLAWRSAMEGQNDPVNRILYQGQLELIGRISSRLVRLSRHVHLAALGISKLGADNIPRTPRLQALNSLLNHLVIMEALLVQDDADRKMPGWQADMEKILATATSEARREVVLSLPADHPLSPWLADDLFL